MIKKYLFGKKTQQATNPEEEENNKGTRIISLVKELHKPIQNIYKKKLASISGRKEAGILGTSYAHIDHPRST